MGEKTEAKALYVRAVKLIEDDDSYGPSDRNLPKFLNNLAAVEDDLGHTQEAQSLRKRALDIQQNASDSKS